MSNRKCLTFDSNVSHILEDHFYPAFNSTRKCLSIGAGSNVKVSSNFNCPYGSKKKRKAFNVSGVVL